VSEPSVWWPIPVTSSRWFSEEERRASRQYHQPIERAVVLRSIAQGLGVVAAWLLIERTDVAWWWVVAAVLTAVTLPRLVADAWHEFIHEPRFGGATVAPAAFAITSLGRIGPRVVLLIHRAVDVPPDHEAYQHVARMAEAHDLPTPQLVELDWASFEGANAYVTGQRSRLTVAVSHRLLSGPDALLRHVVGHEITHLRHHHLLWSALASSVTLGATVAAAFSATMRFADGGARLPVFVLVAAVLSQPFRLGLAWLSRANERQADRAAMRHAPISPELIKQLHLSDRPLLEPSRLARWQSSHPAPAERLEAAARSTRSSPVS